MLSRVVLDTNTVIALWHFRDRTLSILANAIEARTIQLISREDALEELRLVLAYRQFNLAPETQKTLSAAYRDRVQLISHTACTPPAPGLPACRDSDDQKFLEIAHSGCVASLLTRDKMLLKLARHRLIRNQFAIMTPERFCKESESATTNQASGYP